MRPGRSSATFAHHGASCGSVRPRVRRQHPCRDSRKKIGRASIVGGSRTNLERGVYDLTGRTWRDQAWRSGETSTPCLLIVVSLSACIQQLPLLERGAADKVEVLKFCGFTELCFADREVCCPLQVVVWSTGFARTACGFGILPYRSCRDLHGRYTAMRGRKGSSCTLLFSCRKL